MFLFTIPVTKKEQTPEGVPAIEQVRLRSILRHGRKSQIRRGLQDDGYTIEIFSQKVYNVFASRLIWRLLRFPRFYL